MFVVDLHKIVAMTELPTYLTKAAQLILLNSYMTTGEYFYLLDDVEVYELCNAVNNIKSKDYKSFGVATEQQSHDLRNISLLCFLLATGEGEIGFNHDLLPMLLHNLSLLSVVEDLKRKGSIDVNYLNYSLFNTNRPVILKKDKDES